MFISVHIYVAIVNIIMYYLDLEQNVLFIRNEKSADICATDPTRGHFSSYSL